VTWSFADFWWCGVCLLDYAAMVRTGMVGVDEVEGAALGAGGFGEFVDLDVGVLVADSVAG
jgi:hypothetical protein